MICPIEFQSYLNEEFSRTFRMADEHISAVAERSMGRHTRKDYGAFRISDYLRLTSVQPDKVCFEFHVRPEFLNPFNQVQSGILTTMTDTVTYVAASVMVENLNGVSVELSVRCLQDMTPGQKVYIEAEATRGGPKLVDGRAVFRNKDGVLLAQGSHTIYIVPTRGSRPLGESVLTHFKIKSKL